MKRLTWVEARAKVDRERQCRVSKGCAGPLQAAHVIGRTHDNGEVDPDRIIPLCEKHHRLYDGHGLDLLGYLTPEEEARAVLDAKGLEAARRRIMGPAWRVPSAP